MATNPVDQIGKAPNVDIVEKIRQFCFRKAKPADVKEPLVTTKAALFGLDLRMRFVEERNLKKRLRQSTDHPQVRALGLPGNRHLYPS